MASNENNADSGSVPSVEVSAFDVEEFAAAIPQLTGLLSAEEQERAVLFHFEEDRNRFVLGRAMVRRLCGNHLKIAPRDVRFGQSDRGKPFLAESNASLEFNVSHSGGCVMLAWSLVGPVGIDVESMDRRMTQSFTDIAATVFSDEERGVLATAVGDQVSWVFLGIWVRKEALIKAEGCGIGGPLKKFSVVRKAGAGIEWASELVFPESGRRWSIAKISCPPGHLAAVAMPAGVIVKQVRPEDAGLV